MNNSNFYGIALLCCVVLCVFFSFISFRSLNELQCNYYVSIHACVRQQMVFFYLFSKMKWNNRNKFMIILFLLYKVFLLKAKQKSHCDTACERMWINVRKGENATNCTTQHTHTNTEIHSRNIEYTNTNKWLNCFEICAHLTKERKWLRITCSSSTTLVIHTHIHKRIKTMP